MTLSLEEDVNMCFVNNENISYKKNYTPAMCLKLLQQVVIVLPKVTNFTFQTSNTFRNYMIPEVSVVLT